MSQIAIMQPTYLPWIGYFDLIDQSNTFVFLDTVQFERQSWQQRNRVKIQNGLHWLSVPVLRSGHSTQSIREMEIAKSPAFPLKHLRTIEQHYRRAPYFDDYFPAFEELLSRDEDLLSNLNQALIQWIAKEVGIQADFKCSSDLRANGKRSELLVNICLELGSASYLSPLGSAGYILEEQENFALAGIAVSFQHYEHPNYRQLSEPFLPYASMLDLLFNEGDKALDILRSGRRPHYSLEEARHRAASRTPETSL